MANRAWKSGLLLALGASCHAGETLLARIQVVVYDVAALGTKTLASAENLTGQILLASGLEAEWSTGPISDWKRLEMDFTPRTRGECASVPTPSLLRVQFLRRAPAGLAAQVLGFSLPCAMTGIQITIYTIASPR